jgi:hypothetical protein
MDPTAHVEAADLKGLEPGRRYDFVVRQDGTLAVAQRPWVEDLAVRTAGTLSIEREPLTVHVDQDSDMYCPTFGSLSAAVVALERLGVPGQAIALEDHDPHCPPPSELPPGASSLGIH